MSGVRNKGVWRVRYSSEVSDVMYTKSPGCTLECEKVLDDKEELAKLSGEVITYKEDENDV